jgi:hypothetical protein
MNIFRKKYSYLGSHLLSPHGMKSSSPQPDLIWLKEPLKGRGRKPSRRDDLSGATGTAQARNCLMHLKPHPLQRKSQPQLLKVLKKHFLNIPVLDQIFYPNKKLTYGPKDDASNVSALDTLRENVLLPISPARFRMVSPLM